LTLPERLCSGRQLQGLNTMCSQSYSAFCVKLCLGMCFPAALFSPEDGSTTRTVLDVIRHGGVPYVHEEIEHDVIAALMCTRVQIPHKRFLEKAFR
jgi:hypothetical protein